MKKRTKIALTAAVLLLVCGIGLCTAAFAVGAGSGRLYEEMQEFPSVQDIPEKILEDISNVICDIGGIIRKTTKVQISYRNIG